MFSQNSLVPKRWVTVVQICRLVESISGMVKLFSGKCLYQNPIRGLIKRRSSTFGLDKRYVYELSQWMFYSTFELTCKWFKKWIGPGSSIFRYKKAKFFETDYVTNWWLFERLKLKLSVQQSQLHTRSTV